MRILGFGSRMKSFGLTFVVASIVRILGQPEPSEVESPKQVLEEFVKSDLDGGRLTEKGSFELSRFFIQRIEPQKGSKIVVVSNKYDLQETELIGDRATFVLQFTHFYGKLDSAANFETAPDKTSNGVPIKEGVLSSFTLVQVRKREQSEPTVQEKAKVDNASEWRIASPQPPITISLTTAIRYLTEISKTDSDSTRTKNAARTLAQLRSIH